MRESTERSGDTPPESDPELPEAVLDEAERLTRLAREVVDEDEAGAYRRERDELVAAEGFTARVRGADVGDDATLVCYPAKWIDDGTVRTECIDDVDRGVERPLEGPGDDDWETVAETNDAIVDRVADAHGAPHAATARALADFASNHYAKPIADLTPTELTEFTDEYFPRNAWPSEEQSQTVETTLDVVFEEVEAAPDDPP